MKSAPLIWARIFRCVESAVLTIERHPQLHPVAVDEFRHALIRRFPFEIFYEATPDAIVIYSVFHCSQNPQKWRKRFEGKQWLIAHHAAPAQAAFTARPVVALHARAQPVDSGEPDLAPPGPSATPSVSAIAEAYGFTAA